MVIQANSQTKYRAIEVRKLTPTIGAEIHGINLSKTIDTEVFAELQTALLENLVIFFRDQKITPQQQIMMAQKFGDVYIHPLPIFHLQGHPEIMVIHADEKSKYVAGEDWHSDGSYENDPPWGTMLYLLEVPTVGGDTLWANMYKAYDALSDKMKEFLSGLTAMHDRESLDAKTTAAYGGDQKTNLKAEHPIIRSHPVTNRKLLYVNQMYTTRIVQLKSSESSSVLQYLFRHIETPEFNCRFKWQTNSIALWDNRCTQHHAIWDYFPQRRHGHRVIISDKRSNSIRNETHAKDK